MALSQADLWKLLVKSKLLTEEQSRQLIDQFASASKGDSAKSAAEWLIRQRLLSKYQATILLSGRAGPFIFGDYKVYDRIEEGRLRKIYRAVHLGTSHPVLIRFLSGPVTESTASWRSMLEWLPVTADANLTRCYEAVDAGKHKYLVMEDLRGESLADVLARSARVPPDEACRMMRLAAIGLARLHDHGKVHGDFRPHQCWVEPNGNLKLVIEPEVGARGFDLSKVEAIPDGLARSDYAAPEFTLPGRIVDPLSDIYALGCTLYQLVTGTVPFPGGTAADKLRRHASEAIKTLDDLEVPAPLVQTIAYAMAKNPAVRFQNARMVADQLARFVPAAHQNPRSPVPLPTAVAYESWLQQKTGAPGMASTSTAEATSKEAEVAAVPEFNFQPTPKSRPTPAPSFEFPSSSPSKVASPAAEGLDLFGSEKPRLSTLEQKRRVRARRRSNWISLGIGTAALIVAGAIGTWLWLNPTFLPGRARPATEVVTSRDGRPKPPAVTPSDRTPAKEEVKTVETPPAIVGREQVPTDVAPRPTIVPDDGQSLWLEPTDGTPITLEYVPPRAQMFLVARPSNILANPEGDRVIRGLGPGFESLRSTLEQKLGVQLDEVDQLLASFHSNGGGTPKISFVLRVNSDIDANAMLGKWGQPAAVANVPGLYQQADAGYYLPPNDKRVLVVGPIAELQEGAQNQWKAPLIRREIAQLVQSSDSERHLTCIFSPTFLLNDGRTLLEGELAQAIPTAEWLLGDDVLAGSVSLHLDENFYFEVRMESDPRIDRYRLASRARERLAEVPEATELYIAKLNPHPYWRLIANRYPQMIRFLHQQSRIGVDGEHAVVNAVLPGRAAHNLAFGGEMLLASAPADARAGGPGKAPQSGPASIDEVLKANISISFAQDSLEFAMQNVVAEVGSTFPNLPFEFKIRILGPDLEKDGITRNQQVREFNQKDTPVADVLTAMVRKANPITTVKEPHELDQKLVWVVGPDPDKPANRIVMVTTRSGAEQRKLPLPPVFQPK